MDTGKLKLCPFCGYNDQINEGLCSPTLGPDGETNSPAIIVCPNCGSSGPPSETESGSVNRWNDRKSGTLKIGYEDSQCTVCRKAFCTNLLIDLKAEEYGVICIECAITIYKAVKQIKGN